MAGGWGADIGENGGMRRGGGASSRFGPSPGGPSSMRSGGGMLVDIAGAGAWERVGSATSGANGSARKDFLNKLKYHTNSLTLISKKKIFG